MKRLKHAVLKCSEIIRQVDTDIPFHIGEDMAFLLKNAFEL